MKRTLFTIRYRVIGLALLTLLLLVPLAFRMAAKHETSAPAAARRAAAPAVSAKAGRAGMVAYNINPFLDCVEFDPETKALTAYFGYESFEKEIVQILVGIDNHFIPNPPDRLQPILFFPGLHERAFRITAFEPMVWSFSGFRVGASTFSSSCGCNPGLTTLEAGSSGTPYPTTTLTPTGGSAPYSFFRVAGLPAGMTFSATSDNVTLGGTPTQLGSFIVQMTAQDSAGCPRSSDYHLTINCPALTLLPPTLPGGTAGSVYPTTTLTPMGGTAPYRFTVTGTLPNGMAATSNTTGVTLTGTPTNPGTFTMQVAVQDAYGCPTTASYTLQVSCPTVPVLPTLSYAPQALAVNSTLTVNPVTGPSALGEISSITVWSTSAELHNSVSVNSVSGQVTITRPTVVGSHTITIRATDSCGGIRDASLPLVVTGLTATRTNANPVTINGSNATTPYPSIITMGGLAGVVVNVTASLTLRNDGATPLSPANLRVLLVSPDNKALVLMANAGGAATTGLSATQNTTLGFADNAPTNLGLFGLNNGNFRPTHWPGAIAFPAPAPTSYQSPAFFGTGTFFSTFGGARIAAPNGDWKLYVVNAGNGRASLVSWTLNLQSFAGVCSGGYALGTRDANNNFIPLPATGLLLPWQASTFTIDVQAASGCNWNASSLDSGLTIVSGKSGSGNGQVTFSTSTVTAKRVGTLFIAGKLVTVTQLNLRGSCTSNVTVSPPSVTSALAGVPFSANVTASGGSSPYNLSTGSRLPAGLTLTSNGQLSGTPQETGVFPLMLRAIDAQGCQNTVNYTLTVTCPPLTLRPDNLPDGTVGRAYSKALATAPLGGYMYTVIAGNLPAGLTLNAQTGVLSGTPTAKYSNKFTVQAACAGGCGGQTREYKLKVKK